MKANIPASLRRLLLLAGFLPVVSIFAQTAETEQLAPYVLTATRSPSALTTLGSNVDILTAADLARQQLGSFRDALGGVAGAPAFSTGAAGAMTSLFLRGANSNQTLFLVDGIRFNDPNTDYAVALGGMCVGACDNLEVAHGPQSTLYGGEAVGGVISLRSQRGVGPGTQTVSFEAGSFGTVQGAISAQAGDAKSAYSFSAIGGHTDNDRANNDFDSATYTLRFDHKINDAVAVGATWRGFNGVYGSPGAVVGFGANDPDNKESESNQLATVFADFIHSSVLSSHLVIGGQDRRYVSENPDPAGTTVTVIKNRRAVLDWQTVWQPNEHHRVTGGLTGETNTTSNNGFGKINESQTLLAFFAQDEFSPVENIYLTAGLRSDDFDTFGRATTGKASAAWLTADKRLKFRASYGTAFRSPSFLDLYGRDTYYVGNPNLKAEKARGWDAGADYYLPGDRGTLSVTWFEMKYRNLITYDFNVFPSTVQNVEDARSSGLELAGKFTLPGAIEVRLAYTYLEADNLTEHIRLLRRPRHSGSVDVWRSFGAFSLGGAINIVVGREDVDAATFATIEGEDYTVVRVYAAYQISRNLTLKARVENALDEKYAQVNGYPQPGTGIFGGVEWKF